jgi:putative FmdB family regulatory protein
MIYRYECQRCGTSTEQIRKLDDRDKLPDCPECHHLMLRVPVTPAPTFPGADTWRGRR